MPLRGILLFPLEQACTVHLEFQCICRMKLAGHVYKKTQFIYLTVIVCWHQANSYCQFSDGSLVSESALS